MSNAKQDSINVSNINSLSNSNNNLSNITISNSIKIPKSADTTASSSNNQNAGILIKDVNSNGDGNFFRLHIDSSAYTTPYAYFNNNIIIDESNLVHELETKLVSDNYTLDTSNITCAGGYINFFNGTHPNLNQGNAGVGIRYSNSNNTVQFKNFDTDWIDLVDITNHDQFSELVDVDVHTNPLLNNQYITYNSSNSKYVNSNLAIINDTSPSLGSNLYIGNNMLQFGSNTNRLVYNGDNTADINNNIIVLKNNTSQPNASHYIDISNAEYSNVPTIVSNSTVTSNIGLTISTKGTGEMQLISGNNMKLNNNIGNIELNSSNGNIYANTDSLIISGFVQNSIFRTSSKPGGYNSNSSWTIPLTNDTILFDFINTSPVGTYWANVSAGFDGQKLNLIYNNRGSNVISIIADFGSNGVIVGTGYSNGLVFTTSGQSSSLVYLGDGIDAWQVLNTGAGLF